MAEYGLTEGELGIVHLSPGYDLVESEHPSPAVVRESREREFGRIFGQNIEITYLSEVGLSRPEELAAAVRGAAPDAVVLASGTPSYRQAIIGLITEMLVPHPGRTRHGSGHACQTARPLGRSGAPMRSGVGRACRSPAPDRRPGRPASARRRPPGTRRQARNRSCAGSRCPDSRCRGGRGSAPTDAADAARAVEALGAVPAR